MSTQSITLRQAVIAALAISASTAAVTYALVTASTEEKIAERVNTSMTDLLPQAIAEATKKVEDEKRAVIVESNLSGWELASDSAPAGRHLYGSPDAEFTLVEFSDFECSFCKRFHQNPKSLVDQAGGRLNWEWMHYPLGFHNPASSQASHASLCVSELAGNRSFWAFTDSWFKNSGMGGRGVSDLTALAEGVGVDPEQFTECMDSQRYAEKIAEQVAKGTEMGVTGTPGTFVVDNITGNRVFVRGAQEVPALIQAIQQLQGMREESGSEDIGGDQNNG